MKDSKLRKILGYDEANGLSVKRPNCRLENISRDLLPEIFNALNHLGDQISLMKKALMEKCTYCGEEVPKGQLYETGEKGKGLIHGYIDAVPYKACDRCLKRFKDTCEAAKTGYANKAKKEKK